MKGSIFSIHRLIWTAANGHLVHGHIDHIDGNRSNNKLSNLRVVRSLDNCRNAKKRKDCTSGVTGVSFCNREGKWLAYISGKKIGRFQTKEEAILARNESARLLGFHENHGR